MNLQTSLGIYPFKITDHPHHQKKIYGSKLFITVSATGSGELSYQWIKDGRDIFDDTLPNCCGTNTSTLCIKKFLSVHEGEYTCRINTDFDNKILISNAAKVEGK